MAKLLASFKNKENAIALRKKLMNNVKHVWVCIFTATENYPYYDVDVQGSNDSPCAKDKLKECEDIRDSFETPIPETIIMPEEAEVNKTESISEGIENAIS